MTFFPTFVIASWLESGRQLVLFFPFSFARLKEHFHSCFFSSKWVLKYLFHRKKVLKHLFAYFTYKKAFHFHILFIFASFNVLMNRVIFPFSLKWISVMIIKCFSFFPQNSCNNPQVIFLQRNGLFSYKIIFIAVDELGKEIIRIIFKLREILPSKLWITIWCIPKSHLLLVLWQIQLLFQLHNYGVLHIV